VNAFSSGQYEEALKYFQLVLSVEPCSAQVHYFIGEVLRKQRKMKDSFAEYQNAIICNSNYAPAYLGLALWSKQSNPANDYLDDINKALVRDPNYIQAYIERAEWYGEREEDWEAAKQDLERANQLSPENPLVMIRLGRVQLHLNQPDLALENITLAQIKDPTILEGYLAVGEVYNTLKQYNLAVDPLKVFTIYASDDIYGWLQLGAAYIGISDYPKAITACTQAIDIDVNSARARLCRGEAYYQSGEFKSAVADLEIAVNKTPNWYSTQFLYGKAQLAASRPDLAIKAFAKAIELSMNAGELADAMGWQALSYEAYNSPSAKTVWQNLMNLDGCPEYWKVTAYMHYYGLNTPTPEKETTPTPESSTPGTPLPTYTLAT
jgi:tetratricopeptide (TPR) repeat protein